MRAVNNYIIVEKIKAEQKEVGGLIFTEATDVDNRYLRGRVVSVGDKVTGVFEDEVVRYDKHAGNGIDWAGDIFHVIKIQDVVLIED